MDNNYDPIQNEKTFLEKIWESIGRKKKRKVIITTSNPYRLRKNDHDHVLCSYKIEDQEKMEEALWSFKEAVLKTGMTVNELQERFKKL